MKNKNLVLERIQTAKSRVSEAEDDLSRLLGEIQASARAEKVTISKAIQGAFDKLRSAREQLVSLEELTSSDEN